MKRPANSLWMALCLWLLLILSSPYVLTNTMMLPFMLCQVVVIVVSVVASPAFSFVVVISLSLLSGFGLTAYSFFYDQRFATQFIFMKWLLLSSLSMIVIWSVYDQFKKMVASSMHMSRELNVLRKFDCLPNVLSFHEFIHQATYIATRAERKQELGYFVEIRTISRLHAKQSVTFTLAALAVQTVRTHFDLVCRVQDHTLLLFLQHTTLQGVDVVLQRLRQKGSMHFNGTEPPYVVTTTPISSMTDMTHYFHRKGITL